MFALLKHLTRRDLVRGGGLLALARGGSAAPPLKVGPDIYQSIGVRPVINCKGTFTIVSGSLTLPEVKRAMDEASRHYIHLDELMEAVGKRLAELTGAGWGIVTAGCAAALTHATAACIAGSDPEKMQRLPNLAGLKSEVIMPRYSRNVYDHAVRMLGVKIVEVTTIEQAQAAITARTAMIHVLGGPQDDGPLGTAALAALARPRGIPLLVDAAAEILTIPNIHLQRGADMVAYSGGKCIRGPQCAGLLLGRKDLLQAAWINSAPHHAFGRSLKVGKEEIMGMLAAVEAWVKRDHDAEWKQWEGWLDRIAQSVTRVNGVSTQVRQPNSLSNHAPTLQIRWDPAALGVTGQQIEKLFLDTDPRIVLGSAAAGGVGIMPYMMMPGDDKVVAERLYVVLSHPPKSEPKPAAAAPVSVAGQWEAHLEFLLGSADHTLVLEQDGANLVGTHRGDILQGDLRGTVEGNQVRFRSSQPYEGTRLNYDFTGTLDGDTLSGRVGLGEYGEARFTARRHRYPEARRG